MMTFSGEEMRGLRTIAERENATMFMVFLAGFFTLLHRYSRAEDISVGSGIANRRMPETDDIVGMLINTVVLRANLTGNPSFLQLLERIRTLTLEAYANQETPFDRVVDAVNPSRHPSINPLHQVTFNFQNNPMPAMTFDGVETVLERPLFNGSAKYDLYVAGWPRSDSRLGDWQRDDEAVLLSWEYNLDIFDRATIQVLQEQFRTLLNHAAAAPETQLTALRMEEQRAGRVPRVAWSPPVPGVVHERFAAWAARTPNAVAVEYGERKTTYGELDAASDMLARRILHAGFRGQKIAVVAKRTPHLVHALLGILKAGGSYVPIDPDQPPARVKRMVRSLGLKAVVGDADAAPFASAYGLTLVAVDEDGSASASTTALPQLDGSSTAYVLFTSGSTGEPMAVAVPHRAVVRLVTDQIFASISADEKWLLHSSLSFDASTLEIWGPLCNGGCLALLATGAVSLHEIGDAIRQHAVTSLWLTAGLFSLAAAECPDIFAPLRQLLTGGDVVPTESVRTVMALFPNLRIVNGYGPTENTTFTCCCVIGPADLARRSIPIGEPVRGTTVFVLDAAGHQCATGIPGELCAGGHGLAFGYVNSERATKERFIDHPEFGRLYQTGDLCRMLPDGRIEFLGRQDRQIKVSGVRIEPSEVESALTRCRGVLAAAVCARGDNAGNKTLAAFIVPAETEPSFSMDTVRSDVAAILPRCAIPSHWNVVPELPVTANGKIDYAALEHVERHDLPLGRTADSEYEKQVAAIWAEVLGIETPSADSDFFSIGGHSLGALRILALIKSRTGVPLTAAEFFRDPTISGLTRAVEEANEAKISVVEPNSPIVRLRMGHPERSAMFVPGGWGEADEILVFAALARRMKARQSIYAVRSRVHEWSLSDSIQTHATHVADSLRSTGIDTGMTIIGECAASTVAVAISLELISRGTPPSALILLDPGDIAHIHGIEQRIAVRRDGQPTIAESLPCLCGQILRPTRAASRYTDLGAHAHCLI